MITNQLAAYCYKSVCDRGICNIAMTCLILSMWLHAAHLCTGSARPLCGPDTLLCVSNTRIQTVHITVMHFSTNCPYHSYTLQYKLSISQLCTLVQTVHITAIHFSTNCPYHSYTLQCKLSISLLHSVTIYPYHSYT